MAKQEVHAETLPGMPAPFELCKQTIDGETVISFGSRAMFVFDPADRGMRNLAIVALTRAGVRGVEVAQLFELRPEHVSRLRARAAEGGSGALVVGMGRPRSLDAAGISRAFALYDEGRSGAEIAAQLGVSAATISRVLAKRPRPEPPRLDLDLEEVAVDAGQDGDEQDGDEQDGDEQDGEGHDEQDAGQDREERAAGRARLGECVVDSRYGGAMLLHGFFDRAGARNVLAALPSKAARHYDAASVMLAGTFGFALGSSSAEGTKHLLSADAGAVIGLERFPHLRTLRPRLAALSGLVDPLEVQVRLATAMLEADEDHVEVFFVDDHFVAYTGSAPLGKGWNTRRRLAEPGRDDTLVVDEDWRAICFSSGAPSSLSKTMLGPLEQLRRIVGDRRVMIGFDRGGAFPKTFAALKERDFDWVTYRRAPLAAVSVAPTRTWASIDGRRHYLSVADETVVLPQVGDVRQISIYEEGEVALQILTSDATSTAALLARRLVHRWRIENAFKYLEDHHGIHWLCDYAMEVAPDTTQVANPQRKAAKVVLSTAEKAVSDLEQAIGATASNHRDDLRATNAELARLGDALTCARDELEIAREKVKAHPAKVVATELDPDATRAVSLLGKRALQMVCRLLAYNAELDLARALNAYLEDDDEYRAITRNLLHQPGTITYGAGSIDVSLRAPDSPRVARALRLLCDQLNTQPPRLTGDERPITYRVVCRP